MYTIEELIKIASTEGAKVTVRQIREWNSDGLLPTPIREKIPGQGKGRAPYRFPEPAPAAVVKLAKERRYMKSAQDAKLWLWLEGFDYLELNPDKRLRDWLIKGWEEELQARLQLALDPPDVSQLDEESKVDIYDKLDRQFISPMTQGNPQPEEYAAYSSMLSALIGFSLPQETDPISVGKVLLDRSPNSVRRTLSASMRSRLPKVLPEELEALAIPEAIGEQIPRQQVRAAWKTFCAVTESDISKIPDTALEAVSPNLVKWLESLRKLRFSLYRDDPEYVLFGLSCVIRYLSEKHPHQLKQSISAMRGFHETMGSSS